MLSALLGVTISWLRLLQVSFNYSFYFKCVSSFIRRLGSAISWDGDFNVHTEGEVFSSVIDLVLNCACFIYIGAWLPFKEFNLPEIGISPWKLVVLTIGIIFLRRIPAIVALYKWIPEISSWREALFSGHFGTKIHKYK